MRYIQRAFVASLAATALFSGASANADIDAERTPAGKAGMEQLNRGLDSRTQQTENLRRHQARQRRRLEAQSNRGRGANDTFQGRQRPGAAPRHY